MREFLGKHKKAILMIAIILYFILVYILSLNFNIEDTRIAGGISIAVIIIITACFVIKKFKKEGKIDYRKIIFSIILIGLILRTVYILYTPITGERQHDVNGSAGHIGYVEVIYNTGKLPESNDGQFYHPPLHYIISAGWLKVNDWFGVDLANSEEGIQILTAIYSSAIMLITYCILKELDIKDKYKTLVMAIVAIHPTFIILAGSVNNDILMIMLTCITLLYLIKWHKNTSWKNTLLMAIFVALTALTKISGTIIAVPILYIFIDKLAYDFAKDKKKLKSDFIKIAVFGIIALSLGLSYAIRNNRLFDQEIFFVHTPGEVLYCGDKSIFERLNIFSSEWKDIYGHPFEDCNMIVYLIKTSVFGEYCLESSNFGNVLAVLILIFNVIIIIVSLINFIISLRSKENRKYKSIIDMLLVFFVTEIGVYIYGNFSKPYGCTMDIRYIVPTIILGMLFIVTNMKDEHKKYNIFITAIVAVFLVLCMIFELTVMKDLSIVYLT